LKEQSDPADAVLKEIEAIGQRSFIPSIGPVKGRILAEIVKKTRPKEFWRSERSMATLQY